MLDIVFSDSALGSLKMAQYYGQGEYNSGGLCVFVTHHDGGEATPQEIEEARREAEKREKLAWENGAPLGGDPADVLGFDLALSIGDISELLPGAERGQVMARLFSIHPDFDFDETIREMLQMARETLSEIQRRTEQGEPIRLWYSNQPDEICGMYWFITWLVGAGMEHGKISVVRLPPWEIDENGNIIEKISWGEVSPGEWQGYLKLEEPVTEAFIQKCANRWRLLQKENAPLRAVLNGRLVGVSETIYDEFIRYEISLQNSEFQEMMVVGKVLGKYRLGINDAWIALRIEQWIRAGELEPVTKNPKKMPIYSRILRKTFIWNR